MKNNSLEKKDQHSFICTAGDIYSCMWAFSNAVEKSLFSFNNTSLYMATRLFRLSYTALPQRWATFRQLMTCGKGATKTLYKHLNQIFCSLLDIHEYDPEFPLHYFIVLNKSRMSPESHLFLLSTPYKLMKQFCLT